MSSSLVLFDFDGVIFDSSDVKTQSFVDVYREEATPEQLKEIELYHRENFGINRIYKFQHYEKEIFKREYTEERIIHLCDKFAHIVSQRILTKSIFPRTKEFLEKLKADQLNLVIVSGAPEKEIREILDANGLTSYFEEIYDGMKSKIEHIQTILYKYKTVPSQMIFLGDGTTDYNAATHYDIPFVAVNAAFPPQKNEAMRVESIAELKSRYSEFLKHFENLGSKANSQ